MTLGRETQEIGKGHRCFDKRYVQRLSSRRFFTLRKKLNAAQIREFLKIYAQ